MKSESLPPVVSVVGWSGSGKTTFLLELIRELKSRGYRVGTIKHHHSDVEVDKPGKDTWHHARAGADTVALAGATGFVLFKKHTAGGMLDEIARLMPDMDIIITEGFKSENKPKIEVRRREINPHPAALAEELIAIVDENGAVEEVPCFGPGDSRGVADLLEKMFLK